MARLPEQIHGFGQVKEESAVEARTRWSMLITLESDSLHYATKAKVVAGLRHQAVGTAAAVLQRFQALDH